MHSLWYRLADTTRWTQGTFQTKKFEIGLALRKLYVVWCGKEGGKNMPQEIRYREVYGI